MFKNNEEFTSQVQKVIDNAMNLVSTSITSMEKLTHIHLETSRQILEETSKSVKELTNINDPKEMFTRINQITTDVIEKNIASTRDVYEVVNEVKSQIGKIAEENVHNMQQRAIESVEWVAKLNPGSTFATEALKSWINNVNQAFNEINKVAVQVAEFNNNNINTVIKSATNVAKKATKK